MAVLGMLCFPLGRLLARIDYDTDRYPLKETNFERKSGFYKAVRIRRWADRLPDISRIFPGSIPKKSIEKGEFRIDKLTLMINETCVAEIVHALLCVAGAALLYIWPGTGGRITYFLYLCPGNIPFIMIQRFTRFRLLRARALLQQKQCMPGRKRTEVRK